MTQRPSPPEDLARWEAVDRYYEERARTRDAALDAALAASAAAGLPPIQVSPLQGKLLHLLAVSIGARRILEIGTLGGYSAIWLGRALPPGGRMVSLELEPKHAAIARASLTRAGLDDRVEVRVGPAVASLDRMFAEHEAPFDLVFIDADKEGYPDYFERALALAHPGTLLVADNVVRRGDVVDAANSDPQVEGVRRMAERVAATPRVSATWIQTVGSKGYDGFAVIRVGPAP
ncbi:MAG TPA: O-methyltransferase [Thermoplasmata archaeon]|nr:O-methyltransferase [Thermoplasmata archaeon]